MMLSGRAMIIAASLLAIFSLLKACAPPDDEDLNANTKSARTPEPTASPLSGKTVNWKSAGLQFNVPADWKPMTEHDNVVVYGDTTEPPGRVSLTISLNPIDTDAAAQDTLAKNKNSFSPGLENGSVESVTDKNVADFTGFRVAKAWPDRDGSRRILYFGIRPRKGHAEIINFTCASVAADFENNRGICSAILESLAAKI